MVIDVAADLVPDVLHELPLVEQAGPLTLEQERRVQFADPACRRIPVETHRALRGLESGLRLATASWLLDEDGSGGAEPTRELRVGDPWEVVADSPKVLPGVEALIWNSREC